MNELHKTYAGKGLVVIGVHKALPSEKTEDFVKQVAALGVTYPVASDDGNTSDAFDIKKVGWPPTFLIDRSGKIQKSMSGKFHTKTDKDPAECSKCEKTFDALKKDIEALLEPPKAEEKK